MGQDPASALPCSFSVAEAQELAGNQLDLLLRTRDVSDKSDAEALRGRIEDTAAEYVGFAQAPDDVRPSGLLFFISDRSAVCALYWESSPNGAPFFSSQKLAPTPQFIRELVARSVAAVIGSAQGADRAPRLRAESTPRSIAPLRSPIPGDAAPDLSALASALFPGVLGQRVSGLASLSIVPALNLGAVPFAALDPDGDGRALVETTAINVEASLDDLSRGVFGWSSGPIASTPAIFGDPDATADPEWVLPRLPGAGREAEAVARSLGAQALVGRGATVEAVLSRIGGADYIHIAAHGVADADDPIDGSFLALTGGRLTARQIQAIGLAASPLVVLSACQTGLGGTLEAGIIGLARAFLIAGAVGVVASLWNVDDEASAFTMVRFVEHLKVQPPSEALRLAQLETRARWPKPAYWAAFILFGHRIVGQP